MAKKNHDSMNPPISYFTSICVYKAEASFKLRNDSVMWRVSKSNTLYTTWKKLV